MNRLLQGALGALSISTLLAPSPASAQISVTANGPYYATPSWSQKLTKSRFVVLANWNHEAVLDRETGLVWTRSPRTFAQSWALAFEYCMNFARAGGRKGWRMPSMPELASLGGGADPSSVALAVGHPFTELDFDEPFWTRSRSVNDPGRYFALVYPAGNVIFGLTPDTPTRVWCVRGGSSQDAP
jgi:hypothetical protein